MGIDNKTLIQVCRDTNDIDCMNICLGKLAKGQGLMNW